MGRRKKIQENDWRYNLLRRYVNHTLKQSYRKVSFVGLERIPQDAAVIYAPNHTGALMDALVILAMNSKPKVFLARADIFKNPKLAKLFRFFKMIPIMRMRDGIEEVKKNNRTIEVAADVLKDRVPICIFPEGTHQTKYSMLPLSKGIFRIALQAKELMPDTPLYIVPMGIRYGNFFRFRSTLRVQVGNPINVGEFIAEHEDRTPQEQMNLMRKHLDERMKEAILYIPNDEEYDAVNEICTAVSGMQLKSHKDNGNGEDPLVTVNRAAAKHIEELKSENPETARRLIELGKKAAEMRKEKRISLKSVARSTTPLLLVLKLMFLLATLPYTLLASACMLPVTLICNTLLKKFKDRAFHNSVRFVFNLVVWPLLLVIYAIIAFCNLPALWALLLTLAIMPSPAVANEAYRLARLAVSDVRLLRCKPLKAKYKEIREIFFNK